MNSVIQYILRLVDQASKPLGDVADNAEEAAAEAQAAQAQVKGLGTNLVTLGAGAAAAATALIGLGQSLADSRNELSDWSTRTGVATETLAGLRLAAKGSGLEFQALAEPLLALARNASQAAQGNTALSAKFAALGVAVQNADGSLRSTDEVLRDVFRSLSAIEDPTERAAAATAVLGEQGTRLLQALGNPAALDHFVAQARDFGVDVGPRAAKAAGDWQRSMATLQSVMAGVGDSFFQLFGGNGLSSLLDSLSLGFVYLSTVAETALKAVADAFAPLKTVVESLAAGDIKGAVLSWYEFLGNPALLYVVADFGLGLNRAEARMTALRNSMRAVSEAAGSSGGGGGGFISAMNQAADAAGAAEQAATSLATAMASLSSIQGSDIAAGPGFMRLGEIEAMMRETAAGIPTSAPSRLFAGAGAGALGLGSQALGAVMSPGAALAGLGPGGAIAGLLAQLGAEGADRVVDGMSHMATMIGEGIGQLPELLSGVLNELPEAIGKAVANAVRGLIGGGGGGFTPFSGGVTGRDLAGILTLGLSELAITPLVKLFQGATGVNVPGYAVGDTRYVNRTGLALLHEGETVVRSSNVAAPATMRAAQASGGGRPVIIQTAAVTTDVFRVYGDQLGEQFNPSGWGRGTRTVFGG